jgi:hypothetical protein
MDDRLIFLKDLYNKNKELTFEEYIMQEVKNNPNFFRWFFNDDTIEDFGTNMIRENFAIFEILCYNNL